jgi:hypothetical protein
VIWGALGGRLFAITLDSGDERVLTPLLALLLLFRAVGAAITGVVFPLALLRERSKIASTTFSPEEWLVAMLRSSFVVRELFCPNLWMRDS